MSDAGVIDKGGRYVVFATRANNIASVPDVNGFADIFIYDIQAQTKKLITTNIAGTSTGGGSTFPGYGSRRGLQHQCRRTLRRVHESDGPRQQ